MSRKKRNAWKDLFDEQKRRDEFKKQETERDEKLRDAILSGEPVFMKWHNPDTFAGFPAYLVIKFVKADVDDVYLAFTYNTIEKEWQLWSQGMISTFRFGRVYEYIPDEETAIKTQYEFNKYNAEWWGDPNWENEFWSTWGKE